MGLSQANGGSALGDCHDHSKYMSLAADPCSVGRQTLSELEDPWPTEDSHICDLDAEWEAGQSTGRVVVLEDSRLERYTSKGRSAVGHLDEQCGNADQSAEILVDWLLEDMLEVSCGTYCEDPAGIEVAELEGSWAEDSCLPRMDFRC